MDEQILLLKNNPISDEYLVRRETLTKKAVFCKLYDISRAEFHAAGRNGLNPEFMVTVFHGDYDGETAVELHGKTYAVYRTYRNGDYVELYCQRKGGTNGKSES